MKRVLSIALAALFVLWGSSLEAYPSFVGNVPNGAVNSCLTCHTGPGGGARNVFGQAFSNNGFTYDSGLAALDSDGDGFDNGTELQDPNGIWRAGDPDPGEPCRVSGPGDATDTPTPVADLTLAYGGGVVTPGTNIDFTADLVVDDCYTTPQPVDVWIDVKLPNGAEFGPVFGPMSLVLPPGFSISDFPISLFVPPAAPTGTYTMLGRTGTYPDTIDDESTFDFDIAP